MHGQVCVTGVGTSVIGRDTGLSEGALALEACRAALNDAGLQASDIDGLSMYPFRNSPPTPFAGPSLDYVHRSLGMPTLRWAQATTGENAQLGAIVLAVNALYAGQCDHVLCFRAHRRQQRRFLPTTSDLTEVWDEDAWTMPYGVGGGAARGALWATRHMYKYGTTQAQMGSVCVNARAYAAHNPAAYWRTEISLDEYLDSRWVAAPLKLLDCDYPVDGATALIFSRRDVASTTRKAVYVESVGTGPGHSLSWSSWAEKSQMASRQAAATMWGRTKLQPSDVDVAQLYDGFSIFTLSWLEDLGFVPEGQGGRYFEDGGGRLDSRLPVNTDGGQLGMGRLHGFGKVAEAVRQLRSEAVTQVPGAEVAVASAGGGPSCACVLLTAAPVTS
jgi:acetyl-CoA acetyltransferase